MVAGQDLIITCGTYGEHVYSVMRSKFFVKRIVADYFVLQRRSIRVNCAPVQD